MPRLDAQQLETILHESFPEVREGTWRIEAVEDRYARVRLPYHRSNLRPGNTISGPALMTLADTAMYAAILAAIGPVLMAVTTALNINFMRKPTGDIIAECRLLKLGSRLAVGEVAMYADGETEMCAHATCTYSIPPESQRGE
ncbi:PaaI family thioesterase [Aquisalimonas lutea]|uniref:PaaI family thioesterase n=1 Tax=Aquisalimonas lutea TaxID=1327750 RepID=UPI0025B60432|nr:PaaI family thioesterase [Aquisalimonas lutea]MDN3516041.1 PaaI family thioesterase [Aquisalimonas lutea]